MCVPEQPNTRAPGIRDVAAAAGVSHQTVSRVINGHANVRPHTRLIVEKTIAELGYRRNTAAYNLKKGCPRSPDIAINSRLRQTIPDELHSIEQAARSAGYKVQVIQSLDQLPAELNHTSDKYPTPDNDALLLMIKLSSEGQ